MAFTRSVFPTPGTPSISACPPASSVTSARSMASLCPTITWPRASRTRRAPLVIIADAADDCVSALAGCACPSEPRAGSSFMRFVPPRESSSVRPWAYQAQRGRHEPDLLRMRGAQRSTGSAPCIPLEQAARARRAAAALYLDLQKWPAHPAATGGGTAPSTPPLPVHSECYVAEGVAQPLQRFPHAERCEHSGRASGVAPDRRSCSKAGLAKPPRKALAQLAAGIAAPAKVRLDSAAVRATSHTPKSPAAPRSENPGANWADDDGS